MARVSTTALSGWLEQYFAAWASNDPNAVEALFAPDAVYWYGPFREPARGVGQIVANWVSGGQPLAFASRHETLAELPDGVIAHWWVGFDLPESPGRRLEMDGILVVRFGADGRCVEHREWYATRELPAAPTEGRATRWRAAQRRR
jgi:ketosteroid isomerase-like protein